ncbi:MAG: hypothetical protein ABEJ03_01725 [Candidatus Nanohaloarchaea archaeon]
MKGASQLVTAALYVGISIGAVTTAVTVGQPALENMRDAAAVSSAQSFMQDLDSKIQQVAAEGTGSSRTMAVSIDRGELIFNESLNAMIYRIESDANVISPQTSREIGNVVLSSNANVKVYNVSEDSPSDYSGPPCYMMENEHIKACIKKVGSENSPEQINTTELLTYYKFKDQDRKFSGNLSVELDDAPQTSRGTGYTQVQRYGNFIGTGEVKAHITSDFGYSYDIVFKLATGSDFIEIDIRNFK